MRRCRTIVSGSLAFFVLLSVFSFPQVQAAQGGAPDVTDQRLFVGANVPWINWGCDFGCGNNGGVSSSGTRGAAADGFGKLKAAGVHTVRWWTFEGDASQITRDSGGPTGLNPNVYADFDAALALADQYDLVYDFVLFNAPSAVPQAWLSNPAQRQRLADALAPLFDRYKNNPRILSWELFNEPEWDIWNNKVSQADTQATVKLLASTIHAHTTSAVTVGSANMEGLSLWSGLGLNFYSPHWYDPMNSGIACARCTDAPTVLDNLGIERLPIVIGEFYAGPDTDAAQRFKDFRTKGYAGAWAWSLFSDKTGDKMRIDLAALGSLAAAPLPTPTIALPKAQLMASWVSPNFASPDQAITIHQDVSSDKDVNVLVDFEVYDSSNVKIWQNVLDNQTVAAGTPASFTMSFTLPQTVASGPYTVKTGLFPAGGGALYDWSDTVGTFQFDNAGTATPVPAVDVSSSAASDAPASPAAPDDTAPQDDGGA